MTLKNRVQQYCDRKNIAVSYFERCSGLSNGYFKPSTKRILDDKISKIRRAFPDLNVDWLQTGDGEMLNPSTTVITGNVTGNGNNFIAGNHNRVGTYAEIVDDVRADDVCCVEQCPVTLPYVKSEIVQSRDIDIRQLIEENSHALERRSVHDLLGSDVNYIQKVLTAAMMPLFQPGDYLFVRFLPRDAKIISGAIYLIDSRAYGAMVRQVYVNGEELHLHSLNPKFKELILHSDEVFSISLVVRSLRSDFNMPAEVPNVSQLMERRDNQIDHLIEQIDKASERESRLISLLEKKY